jgi:hypothetical protein
LGFSVFFAVVTVSACSSHRRASHGTTPGSTTCSGLAPQHDSTQDIIPGSINPEVLTGLLKRRLQLVGAGCPALSLAPAGADQGVPPPSNVRALRLHWVGTVGEDWTQSQAEAFYILQSGDLALRPIIGPSTVPCLGNPALAGGGPADAIVDGRCLHLGSSVVDHPRPTSAAALPTSDPLNWTLTFTFDRATTRRLAAASSRPLFESIDGFAVGRAVLADSRLITTGHFNGGGTEARAHASNVQVPIPVFVGYATTP